MHYKKSGNMAAATRFVVAFALANVIGLSSVRADEQKSDPKAMFKEMSDYMTSQKAISFNYDTNLEIVTPENQKLGLASSGAMTLKSSRQASRNAHRRILRYRRRLRWHQSDLARQARQYLR